MADAKTGGSTLLLLSEPSSGSLLRRTWRIEVTKGPDRGRVLDADSGMLHVGAESGLDLVLTDPSVSRRHATLELLPEGVFVVDCGSSNGTRVGGKRVETAFVTSGVTIGLGRTQLRLVAHDRPADLELPAGGDFPEFVTVTPDMRSLLTRLSLVAPTPVTILLEGEVGTGRRLLARLVHGQSSRASEPLVVFDCEALSPEALEAALFGTAFGEGIAAGTKGTVVIAEVGRLSLPAQARVLEAIESRCIARPGGVREPIDVRFMFTSRFDLGGLVTAGALRQDLYYRIAVVRVKIPPLRDRRDDLPVIARHVLSKLGRSVQLTEEALALLHEYDWPGNVRELEAVLERASASPHLERITPEEILPEVPTGEENPFHEAKEAVVLEFERRYVRAILARHQGNVSHAAKAAGLSRGAFYALMKRVGVSG